MPKKRSSYKESRKIKKRRLVNLARASKLKTLTKNFETLLAGKRLEEAKAFLKDLFSAIDSQACKGFMHRKGASRKKARLSKSLQRASGQA